MTFIINAALRLFDDATQINSAAFAARLVVSCELELDAEANAKHTWLGHTVDSSKV